LISWKHSFRRLNEESETARKKKQALDNLLTTGKISQSTFDIFNNEIDAGIAEIEKQRNALFEKMDSKTNELGEQIKTLEMLLANLEIQHVTGDVEEEVYQREINVLSMGLESAKQELDTLRDAVNQLSDGNRNTEEERRIEPTGDSVDAPPENANPEPQSSEQPIEEPVQSINPEAKSEQKR